MSTQLPTLDQKNYLSPKTTTLDGINLLLIDTDETVDSKIEGYIQCEDQTSQQQPLQVPYGSEPQKGSTLHPEELLRHQQLMTSVALLPTEFERLCMGAEGTQPDTPTGCLGRSEENFDNTLSYPKYCLPEGHVPCAQNNWGFLEYELTPKDTLARIMDFHKSWGSIEVINSSTTPLTPLTPPPNF